MKRTAFFLIALAISLSSPAGRVDAASHHTRPNIVLLFVDDLGWADVHFKPARFDTPNIDRLQQEGFVFTDAYAASPTCSPSRASLVSGQHPARLRLVRHIPRSDGEWNIFKDDPAKLPSRNWLPLDTLTIAEALKTFGYDTAFVGKWHLGSEAYFPDKQGFDETFGVTDRGNPNSYYPPYFGAGHPVYADATPEKYLTDRQTDDAVAYIQSRDGKRPFLLSFFYYAVHSPHVGRKDLVAKYAARGMQRQEAHHAAMFEAVDASVGRIRAALQKAGFADNSILFFLGDQGGQFDNSPLRGGKPAGVALYEGGARIPCVVFWPGAVQAGGSSPEPVTTLDVMPTMIEMAGGNPRTYHNLDGSSLVPLLTGASKRLGRDAIYLYRSYDDQYAAMRISALKLIARRSGNHELYNLNVDLAETENLIDKNPDSARAMLGMLKEWEEAMGVRLDGTQERPEKPVLIEQEQAKGFRLRK